MKKNISMLLILIFILVCVNPILAAPDRDNINIKVNSTVMQENIEIEAQGAILMGLQGGEILFSKNMDKRLYPASTTKILTGLLAIENGDLNEIVTIGNEANLCTMDSSKAGIDIKEEITLENLLYGLMLPSGNDAAYSIAVHIGRKIKGDPSISISDALKIFIDLMNSRSRELGATDSHFVNPDGYHDDQHYTTPHDMALITMEAMKHDVFRKIVGTQMFTIPDWSSLHDPEAKEKEIRYWRNSNLLIQPKDKFYYPDATGVKTGYTSKAMHCLVTTASRDGMEILTVVLGSSKNGKWTDTTTLLDYGFENFELYEPFSPGQQIDILNITNNPQVDWVRVIADKIPVHVIPKNKLSKVTQEIEWEPGVIVKNENGREQISLPAPVSQFQKVGTMIIKLDNKPLDKIDLVTSRAVQVKLPENPKSPIKLQNGIDSPQFNFLNGYGLWQKLGIATAMLALFILVIWISRARRRRRKRYTFRRRY